LRYIYPLQPWNCALYATSGDLAHTHDAAGPYGRFDAAAPYDDALAAWLSGGAPDRTQLLGRAASLVGEAKSCGFTGFVVLQGALDAAQAWTRQDPGSERQDSQSIAHGAQSSAGPASRKEGAEQRQARRSRENRSKRGKSREEGQEQLHVADDMDDRQGRPVGVKTQVLAVGHPSYYGMMVASVQLS